MSRVEATAVRNPAVRSLAAVQMCCGFVTVPVWSMSAPATAPSWQATAHQVAYEHAVKTVHARQRWHASVTPGMN